MSQIRIFDARTKGILLSLLVQQIEAQSRGHLVDAAITQAVSHIFTMSRKLIPKDVVHLLAKFDREVRPDV